MPRGVCHVAKIYLWLVFYCSLAVLLSSFISCCWFARFRMFVSSWYAPFVMIIVFSCSLVVFVSSFVISCLWFWCSQFMACWYFCLLICSMFVSCVEIFRLTRLF